MGYLEGSIPRPATPSPSTDPSAIPMPTTPTIYWGSKRPSQDEWEQHNAYAQGLITLNIKNPVGHGVNLNGTAADSWKSLTDVQDKVTDIGRLAAGNQLRSIRHTEGSSLDNHFCALRKAWKRYNDQGGKMDHAEFRMVVLASMLKEWMIFVSTLGAYTTSTEVIAQITAHDSMLARDRLSQGTPAVVRALVTAQNQRSQQICSNPVCGRTGHTIDKCFKPGGGMEGQYPDWWKKKGTAMNANTQKPKTTANIATTDSIVGSSGGSGEFYALVTDTNPPKTNTPQRLVVTFAASACSDHCFVNRADFITYKPFHDKDGDTAARGGKFKISGTGQVEKRIIFDGRVISLAFENAIHAPDLNHNLISIGHLDKAGCYSVFGRGGMTCLNSEGKPFLSGLAAGSEGTMYEVEVYPPSGPIHQKHQDKPLPSTMSAKEAHARVLVFATRSHDKLTDIDTWHRRLGHVGYSVIERMGREQVVKGMNVTTYEKGQGSCEDCIMGKHTRCPFNDNPAHETEVLERVYIDLWGPARTQSTRGKQYMMQAVDGKSTHTEGYYLAEKSAETTLEAFKSYHVMAE